MLTAGDVNERGGNFAGAVELRNAVTSKFKVDLPATVTFDYPTITALAGFIASKLPTTGKQSAAGSLLALEPSALSPAPQTSVTEIVGISSTVAASGYRDKGKT